MGHISLISILLILQDVPLQATYSCKLLPGFCSVQAQVCVAAHSPSNKWHSGMGSVCALIPAQHTGGTQKDYTPLKVYHAVVKKAKSSRLPSLFCFLLVPHFHLFFPPCSPFCCILLVIFSFSDMGKEICYGLEEVSLKQPT